MSIYHYMEEVPKLKASTYSEAQKKATKKYRENNKEKVNEQRKKYYQNRKSKDPQFLLYKRQKAKEYYQKKKGLNKPEVIVEVIEEVKEEPKEETKEEIVNPVPLKEFNLVEERVIVDDNVHVNKKRKYNRKPKVI